MTSAVDLGGASLSNGDGLEVGRVSRTVQVFVVRGSLYAVNARFGTPPTPDTTYDVVRVGLR